MVETRDNAHKAFVTALARFTTKCPQAMDCLVKNRESMLAFYDFPTELWVSIRTTSPIESAFVTVRLRTSNGAIRQENLLMPIHQI